jgi:type I restriction enzyme S subunit
MDISRITPAVLTEDRLDASYYGTKYLKNETFLKKSGLPLAPIGTLTDKCNCGATPKEVVYDGKGTGLVRTTDVRPNVFLAEGVLRTSELRVSADANVAAVPGDLLYTMSGTIGYAAVVHDGVDVVSFSNTIARARFSPRSGQDSRFTAAFFNCKYGYMQSLRLVSGGIQGHVMPNPFKRLPVPTPHVDAQRYIGDKVRQAERLRERARRLEAHAHSALAEWSRSVVPLTFREAPRRIRAATASPHSLGPSFAWAMQGHTGVPGAKPLSNFVESCACGEPIRADQRTPGPYQYYGASGPIDTHNEYNFDGEYLVVAQDGTIGRACVARGRFWANNHVWVLKVRETVDPDAVAAYLDKHYVFWPGLTTGSVVPKVTSENLMLAAIPGAVASASDAGAQLRRANESRSSAASLAETAKALVEQLTDGRITEAELVAAQKALEAGDRCADREILKALRQSDAPDAKPLITDVDALYALLDGSEGQDA